MFALLLAEIPWREILEFLTPLAIAIGAVINQLAARDAARAARNAAARASEVKTDLHAQTAAVSSQLNSIQETGVTTHTLVNKQRSILLRSLAIMSRKYAEATGDAKDIAVAEEAEAEARDHDERQARVDNQTK
jgi:hypothetical protein